jgi:hypothetical protein
MKKRKPRLEIGRLIVFEVDNNTKYGIIEEVGEKIITLKTIDGKVEMPKRSKKIKKIFYHKPPKKKQ